LAHAQIGAGAPAIAPVQQSFAGALRPAHVGAPAALAQRQVVATRAPVVPAAYHDALAQRFAAGGGKVPGAGDPVVRTAAPAAFAAAAAAHPGKAGAVAAPAGFRVINRAQVHPVGPQGAPGHGNAAQAEAHAPNPAEQQAHAPNAAAPKPEAEQPPRTNEANPANEAHENGVPRPQGEAEHGQPQAQAHDARPAEGAAPAPRAPEGEHAQPEAQHAAEARGSRTGSTCEPASGPAACRSAPGTASGAGAAPSPAATAASGAAAQAGG
jgi:hypothetical protein